MSGPAVSTFRPPRAVVQWLFVVVVFIFVMAVVGAITRLTGSGLSMTEWRPLMGWLPPLSEEAWLEVFHKYQQSPQFQQVNHWMGLADFKQIFWWEYIHRVFGRVIGLVFLFPWLYFLARKRMDRRFSRKTLVAFFLGLLQGVLGWYMVSSGLVDRPEVSHYRLAAHLSLALFVAMYLLWLICDARPTLAVAGETNVPVSSRTRRLTWAFMALLTLQIVWGAFMAGTKAGAIYPTFPDMNGVFLPDAVVLSQLADNPHTIHFVHRILGWILCVAALWLWWRGERQATTRRERLAARAVGIGALLQFLLGVLTVMWGVPVLLGAMHQAGAFCLLAATTVLAHCHTRSRGTVGVDALRST